jgi:hypothetical protein
MATAATAALGAALLASAALAGPTAPLGHSGRWITDAKGPSCSGTASMPCASG